jgi:hypothetical protein
LHHDALYDGLESGSRRSHLRSISATGEDVAIVTNLGRRRRTYSDTLDLKIGEVIAVSMNNDDSSLPGQYDFVQALPDIESAVEKFG